MVMSIDKECMPVTSLMITFSTKDVEGIKHHDGDLVVIRVVTVGFNVKRTLVQTLCTHNSLIKKQTFLLNPTRKDP